MLLNLQGDPKNLKKDDWKDIIKFILPIIDPNTAPSKLQSIKKIKEKLDSCQEEHGEHWVAKMERELGLAQKKIEDLSKFWDEKEGVNISDFMLDYSSSDDHDEASV